MWVTGGYNSSGSSGPIEAVGPDEVSGESLSHIPGLTASMGNSVTRQVIPSEEFLLSGQFETSGDHEGTGSELMKSGTFDSGRSFLEVDDADQRALDKIQVGHFFSAF